MPYIKQEKRDAINFKLAFLVKCVKDADEGDRDGLLNYIISSIIKDSYPINYRSLNAAIGVLECAKLETYRRIIAPYEDIKIKENGDI